MKYGIGQIVEKRQVEPLVVADERYDADLESAAPAPTVEDEDVKALRVSLNKPCMDCGGAGYWTTGGGRKRHGCETCGGNGAAGSIEDLAALDRILADRARLRTERDEARGALTDLCERAERTRGILQNRAGGDGYWGMLDTRQARDLLRGPTQKGDATDG